MCKDMGGEREVKNIVVYCTLFQLKPSIIQVNVSAFLCDLGFGAHARVAEDKMYFLKIRNILNDENNMH